MVPLGLRLTLGVAGLRAHSPAVQPAQNTAQCPLTRLRVKVSCSGQGVTGARVRSCNRASPANADRGRIRNRSIAQPTRFTASPPALVLFRRTWPLPRSGHPYHERQRTSRHRNRAHRLPIGCSIDGTHASSGRSMGIHRRHPLRLGNRTQRFASNITR